MNLLECLSYLQSRKVLQPDWAEGEQCDHDGVAHTSSAREIAVCERLRFGDQRETRLYQTLGEHQPVELRPRFHHEREALLDLGEPGEVDGRHQKLGGPPQFVDAVIDRHRADPGGAFGDISLYV